MEIRNQAVNTLEFVTWVNENRCPTAIFLQFAIKFIATVSSVRVDVVPTEMMRPPDSFTRLIVSAVS
jgi:hypothetical protein